ncbi:MAG: hypothetical protein ACSHW9_01800 [Salinibacterium amurskyense]
MNRRRKIAKSRWGVAFAAAVSTLMVAGVLAPANATETNVDNGFIVDLQFDAKEFQTREGATLRVVSDDAQSGERVVNVVTATGEPARLIFQSVPKELMKEDLTPKPPESVDYSSTKTSPGMVTEEMQSTLIGADPALWAPSFAFAVTRTTASFKWPLSVGEFQLSVDGGIADTSEDGALELRGLTPGTKYSVEITGGIADTNGAQVPVQKTLVLETFSNESAELQQETYSAKTFQAFSTAFMHTTFIPEASVGGEMCNWGNTSYTFGGDNRSWWFPTSISPNQTPNYRTMMWANINWGNPEPYRVITRKNVGQTKLYNNGTLVNSAYASMDQMLFQDAYSSGAYAQVRFNHTAANPLCQIVNVNYGGSVQYNEIVRFYQSGTVEIVGWRKPAPAHEGYIRFNSSTGAEIWTNAFKRSSQGLHCLVDGLCAYDNINVTKSY